jgi:DNA-directed RNA polymerase subunit N (RpoN/RPB10)
VKKARILIDAVLVMCPECGKPIASWTQEELWRASRAGNDDDGAPMCAACGAFVAIPYPRYLPLNTPDEEEPA